MCTPAQYTERETLIVLLFALVVTLPKNFQKVLHYTAHITALHLTAFNCTLLYLMSRIAPLEMGCRGVIRARTRGVLATIARIGKIKDVKNPTRTVGKIALLGYHRIWLARKSRSSQ